MYAWLCRIFIFSFLLICSTYSHSQTQPGADSDERLLGEDGARKKSVCVQHGVCEADNCLYPVILPTVILPIGYHVLAGYRRNC